MGDEASFLSQSFTGESVSVKEVAGASASEERVVVPIDDDDEEVAEE